MMKTIVMIATIIGFLLGPLQMMAYSQPYEQEIPPIAQTLVREGDFAVKLAEALKLGRPADEAEGMSALAAAGVAPLSGWIADYPVTPDILGELEVVVGDAAEAGRVALTREEALQAFHTLAESFGLALASAPEADHLQKEPAESHPAYDDPGVLHHHYYSVGPPVVTYYPPPRDYLYLYGWVPYPFYWRTYWFPGFFILHDFNRVVFARERVVKVVTNHVFEPQSRKVVVVGHRSRARGKALEENRPFIHRRHFDSFEARRGAQSIVERSRRRERLPDSSRALENRGTLRSRGGTLRPESRRDGTAFTNRGSGTESFTRPGTGRMLEGRRPDASGNRRGTSFERPSGSSRGGFDATIRNQGRSSIQRGPSGRTGTSFDRSSRPGAANRSLNAPSMRSFSGSGRGGSRPEMRGSGRSGGRGGSARGGSSGGGCRGRC
jgi:hypothetical protein